MPRVLSLLLALVLILPGLARAGGVPAPDLCGAVVQSPVDTSKLDRALREVTRRLKGEGLL